jgi:hypothetical protein
MEKKKVNSAVAQVVDECTLLQSNATFNLYMKSGFSG